MCFEWILVTGFGPFENQPDNPSRKIVNKLQDYINLRINKASERKIRLVRKELRVSYGDVDQFYADIHKLRPSLFHKKSPLLIIHVGVAGGSGAVRLENFCYNEAKGKDVDGFEPVDHLIVRDEPFQQRKWTKLSLQSIQESLYRQLDIEVKISEDPGRYLCNYSYYKSRVYLESCSGYTESLFVHVPDENLPHSIDQLTNITEIIIKECVMQQNLKENVFETIQRLVARMFRNSK